MIEKKDYVFEAKRMMDHMNASNQRYTDFKDNLEEIIQNICDKYGYNVRHISVTDERLEISIDYLNSSIVKEITALFGRECVIVGMSNGYHLRFKFEDLE